METPVRIARIEWLDAAEGGRESLPPGPGYSTVARFEALADVWPQEAWSVVLRFRDHSEGQRVMIAEIRMLAGVEAPGGLLEPGSRFELFDGRRRVARGEVLPCAGAMP